MERLRTNLGLLNPPKKDADKIKPFDYCASPDGSDLIEKLKCVSKPVVFTAFAVSTVDVMLYSHPKGYLNTLGRYAYMSTPFLGGAMAFVLGSNLAGSIREKDDYWNWFIGGFSTGAFYGAWRQKIAPGLHLGLFLGVVAMIKKQCIKDGTYFLIPDEDYRQNVGFRGCQQDATLTKERPRNWTTG